MALARGFFHVFLLVTCLSIFSHAAITLTGKRDNDDGLKSIGNKNDGIEELDLSSLQDLNLLQSGGGGGGGDGFNDDTEEQFLDNLDDDEDPIDTAADVVGNIAASGAKLAGGALKLQSKLIAPIFAIGAKTAAPIVKLKAKLSVPLVLAGAALSKPLVKKGVKVAAPTIALGQIATAGVGKVTKPLAAGFAGALEPVTESLQPLTDAFRPATDAVNIGLSGLDIQKEVDNVDLQEDVDRLTETAAEFVEALEPVAGFFIPPKLRGNGDKDGLSGLNIEVEMESLNLPEDEESMPEVVLVGLNDQDEMDDLVDLQEE